MTPTETVNTIADAWALELAAGRRGGGEPWQPPNVWASRRRACARAMALDMLHPEDDADPSTERLEAFAQGNEAERAIVARLHRAGELARPPFTVTEQQHRFKVLDRDGEQLITGKMDGRLRFETGARPPFEIKSGRSYQGARTVEDLARGTWSSAALDQLLIYLYADAVENYAGADPWGLVIVRRESDLPAMIPVTLTDHLDRVEAFLRDARAAVDARHGRAGLPPFIDDPSACRRCPHLSRSCDPPLDHGAGARVIVDAAIIEALETRHRNAAAFFDYQRADKLVKDRLRGLESGIAGDFLLTGKWGPATTYDIPADVKAAYAVKSEQGRFTLTIERIGAEPGQPSTE